MDDYDNGDDDDDDNWRAIDSDDDDDNDDDHHDHGDTNEDDIERDDDVDIGFRSYQYGNQRNNSNSSSKNKRSRLRNKEEAIYGSFYENNDGDERRRQGNSGIGTSSTTGAVVGAAPMFVTATKEKEKSPIISSTSTTTTSTNPMFVSATKMKQELEQVRVTEEKNEKEKKTTTDDDGKDIDENAIDVDVDVVDTNEKEEAKEKDENEKERLIIEREQKAADHHFLELLEKAKVKNKKTYSSRISTTMTRTTTTTTIAQLPTHPMTMAMGMGMGMKGDDEGGNGGGVGLGMGTGTGMADASSSSTYGLPSSFGGASSSFVKQHQNYAREPPTVINKDPNVGKWEKHTKGFGGKLLAKMGWNGKGGLGSNRRSFKKEKNENEEKEQDNTTNDQQHPATTTATTATKDTTMTHRQTTTPPTIATPATNTKTKVMKGISRPVEVVVRPNHLGLGFGDFKEASQLKGNRKIEAEVAGIDYDEQLKKERKEKRKRERGGRRAGVGGQQRYGKYHDDNSNSEDDDSDDDNDSIEFSSITKRGKNNSSAIPSTDDLLLQQSWKARRNSSNNGTNKNNKKRRKNNNAPEIIPYTELLERQKQKPGHNSGQPIIIDMRGPEYALNNSNNNNNNNNESSTATTTTTTSGTIPKVGEELLYNLSFLLNTYENKLHSTSTYTESIERKVTSIQSDVQQLEYKSTELQTRYEKLQKAYDITHQVQYTMKNNSLLKEATHKIQTLVVELQQTFTKEERQTLQFWNVLAPTLLSPIVQTTLENWHPFVVMDGTDDLTDGSGNDGNNDNDGDDNDQSSSSQNNIKIIDSFFEWKSTEDEEEEDDDDNNDKNNNISGNSRILCKSMIQNQLIPKLKCEFESSSRWNPVENTDIALDLYEYLLEKARTFDAVGATRRTTTNTSSSTTTNAANGNGNDDGYDNPNQIFPSGPPIPITKNGHNDDDDDNDADDNDNDIPASSSSLANEIRNELIFDAVYPKLQSAILHWKPTFLSSHSFSSSPAQRNKTTQNNNKNDDDDADESNTTVLSSPLIKDPLNLWVLPWLPHLDHPALLPNLLKDCQRKIKGGLSFLQRKISSSNNNNNNNSVTGNGNNRNNSDRDFVVASICLLRPWQNVFSEKSLQRMIVEDNTSSLIPRLARLLSSKSHAVASLASASSSLDHANHHHHQSKEKQQQQQQQQEQEYWQNDVGLLFELHGRRLLSDIDFLSVMEGSVLANWARIIHGNLCDGLLVLSSSSSSSSSSKEDTDTTTDQQQQQDFIKIAIDMYHQWKLRILVTPLISSSSTSTSTSDGSKGTSFSCHRSLLLLRGDQYICRIYYSVLRMIQISHQLSTSSLSSTSSSLLPSKMNLEELEKLEPPDEMNGFSFRTATSRRIVEQKNQLHDEYVKMESQSAGETRARILLKRRNNLIEPIFRDVVEEFANDSGVLFQPRVGANARKDGKQIFLFGNVPIYLEEDVVFCCDNNKESIWKPISLDQIGKMVTTN